MEAGRTFWVLGGDQRQAALAALLRADGHRVQIRCMGEAPEDWEGLSRADCVVLPMPVSKAPGQLFAPRSEAPVSLAPILARISRRSFLCGGRADRATRDLVEQEGLVLWDYFAREELALANAVPTAEGAIQLAMEHMDTTIHGSQVLILGFGRVGQAAALRFRALGAEVTVAARRYEALALAESMSCRVMRLGQLSGLSRFDLVINTVPAPVADDCFLAQLDPDCLLLDLASAPGGVDFAAATARGLCSIHALSLPGKVAPVAAGAAIRDAIYHMLEEREVSFLGK